MQVEQSYPTVKISRKGQVVIPESIRSRYGWEPGLYVTIKSARLSEITLIKKLPLPQKRGVGDKYWGSLKNVGLSGQRYLDAKKDEQKLED